ncbi:MAG: tetratricopeptide repeat protein [Candidatus Omnitrophica bacterium]|nr:tetratricopeptide repeat protein [Candidatus Omnitrophota bacterium]
MVPTQQIGKFLKLMAHPPEGFQFVCFPLLILLTVILYAPQKNLGFVLDDHVVIEQNSWIKNPAWFPKIFTSGFFQSASLTNESHLNYYRPLVTLSFAVDYHLGGLNPIGFYRSNIIFHILNCLLALVFLYLLFQDLPLAGLTALLFCVLPGQEWSVRYITGRCDLLQTGLSLVSFIFYIFYIDKQKLRDLLLSLAAFGAALLTREAAVINLFYLFLIALYRARDFKKACALSLLFSIFPILLCLTRSLIFPMIGQTNSLLSNIAPGCFYFWNALPRMIYPHLDLSPLGLAGLISALIIWGFLFQKNFLLRGQQGFALLWLASGGFSFIAARKIAEHIGPVLSEHFLYLPSLGFALLLAATIQQLNSSLARRVFIYGMLLSFCLSVAVRGYFWQNEETLLRHVSALENQEGTASKQQIALRFQTDANAVQRLIAAAETKYERSLWEKRLGNIYHQQGKISQAIAALTLAAQINPLNVDSLNELGVIYLETGETQRGIAILEQSLKQNPRYADTYRLAGIAYYFQNDFPRAAALLKQSHALNPEQTETSRYLSLAQDKLKP